MATANNTVSFHELKALAAGARALITPLEANHAEVLKATDLLDILEQMADRAIQEEGDQVGCNYKDVDTELRYSAHRIHREQQQGAQS
jgi:hypothetical protein